MPIYQADGQSHISHLNRVAAKGLAADPLNAAFALADGAELADAQLAEAVNDYGVPTFSGGGFDSLTGKHAAAMRVLAQGRGHDTTTPKEDSHD